MKVHALPVHWSCHDALTLLFQLKFAQLFNVLHIAGNISWRRLRTNQPTNQDDRFMYTTNFVKHLRIILRSWDLCCFLCMNILSSNLWTKRSLACITWLYASVWKSSTAKLAVRGYGTCVNQQWVILGWCSRPVEALQSYSGGALGNRPTWRLTSKPHA
jgi:hypothetical protein